MELNQTALVSWPAAGLVAFFSWIPGIYARSIVGNVVLLLVVVTFVVAGFTTVPSNVSNVFGVEVQSVPLANLAAFAFAFGVVFFFLGLWERMRGGPERRSNPAILIGRDILVVFLVSAVFAIIGLATT